MSFDFTLIPSDDIPLDERGAVTFRAAGVKVGITRVGKNIIPYPEVFAVVGGESCMTGAVNEIAFDEEFTTAFIRVNAPATVTVTTDMVDDITFNRRARLATEGVDGSIVTEDFIPVNVVDMVVFDPVILCACGAVTPDPPGRDARVIHVINVIMQDAVAASVPDPNTDRAGEDFTTIMDCAVSDPAT